MGKNFSTNNSSGKRKKSDFYETPYSLTKLLLDNEKFNGNILEPAAGNNAIVKVLKDNNYNDITYYDKEVDFFKETTNYDNIITNPPFSLAMEFILQAKNIANDKIALLLPLNYLHGKKRFDNIWNDRQFSLKTVYVFTRYPLLGETLRDDGKTKTGMMVYAWYIWQKSYYGDANIKWLDNNIFVI